MNVYVITYKYKYNKRNDEYQIYDICATKEIAEKRLKEIKSEEPDKIFNIEEWPVITK